MRSAKLVVWVLLTLVWLTSPALPQTVCGDASGDNEVDISDIARIFDYLVWGVGQGQQLEPGADCDNKAGVTISDASRIVRNVFFLEDVLDCSIQATYTFPSAPLDTVFLPFMVGIPDDVDSVVLPVLTSFVADTRAFYIPGWASETNGPGRFQLDQVRHVEDLTAGLGTRLAPDTAVMLACDLGQGQGGGMTTGRHNFFNLAMHRVQPGLAAVSCLAVTRTQNLRVAVEKNGDLYAPVVQYYEVPVPTPVVTVVPSTLDITATSGLWSVDSYQITFTSDMQPVSFTLATSDSWIAIEDLSPTGYTTPATISVRANASATPPGSYSGQITFGDIDPADATFDPTAIDISLTVNEPVIYPPGDVNCDGFVSIGDIVLLIDCLFIDTRPVPACE